MEITLWMYNKLKWLKDEQLFQISKKNKPNVGYQSSRSMSIWSTANTRSFAMASIDGSSVMFCNETSPISKQVFEGKIHTTFKHVDVIRTW